MHKRSQGLSSTEDKAIRFARALDVGDIDTVVQLAEEAVDDPELSALLSQVEQSVHEESALSPLSHDASSVRDLLRRHLPSAYDRPDLTTHVTVGEVTAYLVSARLVPEEDVEPNRRLLVSEHPIPSSPTRQSIATVVDALGAQLTERYLTRFRDAAIGLGMRRAQAKLQLAATRPERMPQVVLQADRAPLARTSNDPHAAASAVYSEAGLSYAVAVPGIAPLRRLTTSYPVRVIEVPHLNWRRAAEVLLTETGIAINVPEGSDQKLAGFLCCVISGGDLLGCVLTNADDPVERRRFSEAHELAHYVLHFLPLLSQSDDLVFWEGIGWAEESEDTLPVSRGGSVDRVATPIPVFSQQAEDEANGLAALLLMPEVAVHAAVEQHRSLTARPLVLTRRLAGEFLVSRQAMERRLRNLGLIER